MYFAIQSIMIMEIATPILYNYSFTDTTDLNLPKAIISDTRLQGTLSYEIQWARYVCNFEWLWSATFKENTETYSWRKMQ